MFCRNVDVIWPELVLARLFTLCFFTKTSLSKSSGCQLILDVVLGPDEIFFVVLAIGLVLCHLSFVLCVMEWLEVSLFLESTILFTLLFLL